MGGRARLILFLQLGEQAHVLNGNDCLVGEGLEQLDLLRRKGPDEVPRQADGPDRLLLTKQWDGEQTSGSLRGRSDELGVRLTVGNVDDASIQEGPTGRRVPPGAARERPLIPLKTFQAHPVMTGEVEHLTIEPEDDCIAAVTQRDGVPRDRVEDRLYVCR